MADSPKKQSDVCPYCNTIFRGPNTGDIIDRDHPTYDKSGKFYTHKGIPLSDCEGHGCPEEKEQSDLLRYLREHYPEEYN